MSEPMSTYCDYVANLPENNVHKRYHDDEYGVFSDDDTVLFERLILEINQAGLSWETILKKRDGFNAAYNGFDIAKVASYGEPDRTRLLADAGIIRNRLKVDAAIHNARVIQGLQAEFGSFSAWLDMQKGLDKADWVRLFKKHFKFTGGEIVGEFLMSLGYLPGAHAPGCPFYDRSARP
jgi:DNA-3-methyladenine glycosylase I